MTKILHVGATLLLCLTLASCGSVPVASDGSDDVSLTRSRSRAKKNTPAATAQEKTEFEDIQTLYRSQNYEQALRKLNAFEARYSSSRYLSDLHNIHGLIYLVQKKPALSAVQFKKAIDKNPNPGQIHYLIYNLSTAQFESKQFADAAKSLDQIQVESLDEATRVKYYYLKSRIQYQQGLPFESLRSIFEAGKYLPATTSGQSETRMMLQNQAEVAVHELRDISVLENILKEYPDHQLGDVVYYQAGRLAKDANQNGLAETNFRILTTKYPASAYLAQATEALRSIQGQMKVESQVIGVLLPLTGKYAKFGYQALYGVQMAVNLFNQEDPDTNITLAIGDSGETVEQGEAALAKLFYDDHVVAVIGPLLSKGVDLISKRATEIGVPLISLAQQPGIRDDYIFQMGLTAKYQAEEIARYAVEKAGMKNFAVVYPSNPVGTDTAFHFWNAVEAKGGKITAFESYASKETDFRTPIDKALGLFYPDARGQELAELAILRKKENITKRTRMTEKYFGLKPIVDFDAVFIVDEAKTATQIIPTFAYRDVDTMKFLGISTWNTTSLYERAPEQAENCFFVDSFFAGSTDPRFKEFMTKFQKIYGYTPGSSEAIAYDAAKVLFSSMQASGSSSRSDLKEQLMKTQGYAGVTGVINYAQGFFTRALKVLTVKGKQIVEVQ